MSTLKTEVAVLSVLMAVGAAIRLLKLVNEKQLSGVAGFTVRLVLPMLLLTSLPNAQTEADISLLLKMCFAFAILYLLQMLSTKLMGRLLRLKAWQKAENFFILGTTCAGLMGLPIAGAMFGSDGSLQMGIYVALDNIMLWVHKYYMAMKLTGVAAEKKWKRILNPQMFCIVAGVLLSFFKVDLKGNLIWDTLTDIGGLAKYLGMIFLGGSVVGLDKKMFSYIKPILYVSLVKMIAIPIAVGAAMSLIPIFDSTEILVMVILAATPSMSSVPMIIRSLGRNERYAAQCTLFITLCSLVTLPLDMQIVSVLLAR